MAKNTNYFIKLDMVILSCLENEDHYAYEITKMIKEKTNNLIIPKQGTMYPIIYKLLEDEYITSYTEIVSNKARVYYHLEDKGKEHLKELKYNYDQLVLAIDQLVHGGKYER